MYTPPLDDIAFALDVVGLGDLLQLEAFSHVDEATCTTLLEEFGRLVSDVVVPIDQVGDREGSKLDPATGEVRTPPGFREAFAALGRGGWMAVGADSEYGGGGFPRLVELALEEMLASACLSLSLCPVLTGCAVALLETWGTDDQRERYLAPLLSGAWNGTMVMTEPDAGSDLGGMRTTARQAPDGKWSIKGTKIFITWGEHDMAENTLHVVLARTSDAPGTRGLSLFLVPARIPGADGARNGVTCLALEHKLGIHASPTCVLAFEDAVGELVGEEGHGLRAMFTMMNRARISIGLEGLALAERAYQLAASYAETRQQGTLPGSHERVVIGQHPDVRRMLLTMRAQLDAMRLVLYSTAQASDVARRHPDPTVREEHDHLASLLTPIAKAWASDIGAEVVSTALQVHGGAGYIEETGVEQLYRDVRIISIYEGTNGIQAADLATRRLPHAGGVAAKVLLARITACVDDLVAAGGELAVIGERLREGADILDRASQWVLDHEAGQPLDVLAGATPFLRLTGTVVAAWLLGRQALAASSSSPGTPEAADARILSARFYATQLLPSVRGLLDAATAGADGLEVPARDASGRS